MLAEELTKHREIYYIFTKLTLVQNRPGQKISNRVNKRATNSTHKYF